MKSISITGKRNTDKIKSLENPEIICERSSMKKVAKEIITLYENHNEQIAVTNKLYMDVRPLENREIFIKEIEKKINGYKHQDAKKEIYNALTMISFQEAKQKLIECRLLCHYCIKPVKIIYRIVRDPLQWTLDRIDNKKNHSSINTIISCLSCNLKRRNINKDKFAFSQNITIVKVGI